MHSSIDGESQYGEVAVGSYLLEVGSPAGLGLRKRTNSAQAEESDLVEALIVAEPAPPSASTAASSAADLVDEADAATSKIERALSLGRGVAEGRALDPAQIGLELDAVLDLVDRLDKEGKHDEALRLARAASKLYSLARRWADLLRLLRAAEGFGDLKGIAWAKHELGTLQLVAGDVEGAGGNLEEARRLREQIGDRREAAATERNLQLQCERLRQMLREEELVRPTPRSLLSRVPLLIALAALFLAGGVGAGVIAGSGDAGDSAATETTTETVTAAAPLGPGNGNTLDPGTPFLEVAVVGDGAVSSGDGGIACGSDCEEELSEPQTVTLVAEEGDGSVFEGFTYPCGEKPKCSLPVDSPIRITATFSPREQPPSDQPPAEDGEDDAGEGEDTEPGEGGGEDETGGIG